MLVKPHIPALLAAASLLASPLAHAIEVDTLVGEVPIETIDFLGALPTYNGIDDTLDATFVADIDFDAKDTTNRELIWETGGGTIGWSICYEAPSTIITRAAGNGGVDIAIASHQLTQAQIDAGELELAWTFAVDDGTGLQVVAIIIDGTTVATTTHDIQPDWSGGNAAAFGVASGALAAGGGNTSITADGFTSGLINEFAGLRWYVDTYYVPLVDQTDSDGDGIPDATENLFFPGDLTKLGPAPADFDNDGLADPDEITNSTNPTLADSDADGRTDGEEVTGPVTSDPTLADTDSDGLTDGQEVNGDPATDPNLFDTDGDTFSDLAEISQGSDPNDDTDDPLTFASADSIQDWSVDGVQGENGWTNGFYDLTNDPDSNYATDDFQPFFSEFGPGGGQVEPDGNHWKGAVWDMSDANSLNGPAANVPWTLINSEQLHPNGTNNTVEHWPIRRFVATGPTPRASILWHTREQNLGGGGVSGKLFINGSEADAATIAGGDDIGVYRRYWVDLQPGDVIDLALTPHGPSDGGSDGSDGSFNWLRVSTRPFTDIADLPRQPDGSLFVPADAEDSDSDNLWDAWENAFFPADLAAMDATSNSDGDTLTDAQELENDSDPTDDDTDDDLLDDAAEVAAGSNPRNPDTDGDGLTDNAEVNGNPATSPVKADTDDDGYSDPQELALGTDPNDPESNLDEFPTALWAAGLEPEPLGDTFGTDGGIAPSGLSPITTGLIQPYGNGFDGLPQVAAISAAGATQTGRALVVDFEGGITNQKLRVATAPDSIAEIFTTAVTTAPGTIEIVLSPDALDGFNQVVWESGGTGDGHGIFLIGQNLYVAVNDANAPPHRQRHRRTARPLAPLRHLLRRRLPPRARRLRPPRRYHRRRHPPRQRPLHHRHHTLDRRLVGRWR